MSAEALLPPVWFKIHNNGLRHGRISMGSLAAKGLWLELLSLASSTGTITSVAGGVRFIARQTGSTVAEVEACLSELVELESVTLDADGTVTIYGADDAQEELIHKRAGAARRKAAQRQREAGKNKPAAAPTATAQPAPELPAAPTAKSLAALVTQACEDLSGNVDEYLWVLGAARDKAAANPVSPKISAVLDNAVIHHAWNRHQDPSIEGKQYPRLYKCASQLGDAGAAHVIWAIVSTATADITGDPVAYVIAAAKGHASEVAS